ncbi:sensitivity to high expression protein she9 [Entomortierella beljakovae]|nr:sensitivity to high expression protein she9 [Entomortierella beljakovae]
MATNLRLIRSAGSLTRIQFNARQTSFLNISHDSLNSGTANVNRHFSSTISKLNKDGTNDGKKPDGSAEKSEAVQQASEDSTLKRATEEVERKRIEARDLALKEILDSAAAEKKQLEEETKAAQEKIRLAAAKEAEEKARLAAIETAKKEAQEKTRQEKIRESKPISALGEGEVMNSKAEVNVASNNPPNTNKSLGLESSPSSHSNTDETHQRSGVNQTSASEVSDDPLEPLKSKLLPYYKSIDNSAEYIRTTLPGNLRQLSESVKKKDYRETVAQLAEHLNGITGYNAINELKEKVISHGFSLDEARVNLVGAKESYENAISTRSDTQKAINDLLQRKHLWSPNDVIRFTDLYRSEHANEQAELQAKIAFRQAEADVETKSRLLTRVITERYHEEQVWSDKIRAASTYGTWGLVGVNVMAFLLVQAFVEPRRRRKQIERYEGLVQDLTEQGILPDKTREANLTTQGAAAVIAAAAASNDSESTANNAPVAIGGELLGGDDVLLKLMKSNEERLERMETLLLQKSDVEVKEFPEEISFEMRNSPEAGEYVLNGDGSIIFLSQDDVESTEMGEVWREELSKNTRFQIRSDLSDIASKDRLTLILTDGDAKVPATRRDLIVSSLGGAIIGGLIAVAVMMNR